jgi:hypothetical protein
MKTIHTIPILLLFFVSLILSNCSQDIVNQSISWEKKFIYSTIEKEKFYIKRAEGKIFNENFRSRIEMKIYKSPNTSNNIEITIFHFEDNIWKHAFKDSLSHLFLECDSIAISDINKDGINEFMFQRFEGMGNVTDYYCEVYGMKNKQIVKLDKLSSMINICFQTNEKTFTTFEKDDNVYIGRKYFFDKNLNFKLIQEQHLIESKNKWLKINYTMKNGRKILENQKLDDSLDKEFYYFLNWCKGEY